MFTQTTGKYDRYRVVRKTPSSVTNLLEIKARTSRPLDRLSLVLYVFIVGRRPALQRYFIYIYIYIYNLSVALTEHCLGGLDLFSGS